MKNVYGHLDMDEELLKELDFKIEIISEFFFGKYESQLYQNSISLLSGRSGSTLVQSLILEALEKEGFRFTIEHNVEYLVDKLENERLLTPDHCNGLAGLGWLLIYLKAKGYVDFAEDEFFEELDSLLINSLDDLLEEYNFDLLHGAMGIGLYFLKRGRLEPVGRIVDALYNHAVIDSHEVKWFRHDKYLVKSDIFDFGLAHGNAGILYFLFKAYKGNVHRDKCSFLIEGGVKFFLNNIQDFVKVGSYFPASILRTDYETHQITESYSRLAWCYGDLGILYTLFEISRHLLWTDLNAKIVSMLEKTTQRKTQKETSLLDSSFCHGASGVGYIYLKLYRASGNLKFKEAYLYWLQHVIDQGSSASEASASGYLFDTGPQGLMPIVSLLSGLGAVQVFLLSVRYPGINDAWDEALFLS